MSRGLFFLLAGTLVIAACADSAPEPAPSSEAAPAERAPLDTAALRAALPDLAAQATLPLPRPAPDFALPTLDGDTLRMADLEGNLVLVNFWATWCPPCIAEIPDLNELYEALSRDGLVVLGVSEDQEGIEVVAPFAAEHAIAYPVVLDPEGTLARAYGGVFGLPTTFLVSQEGEVVNRFAGLFPAEEMRDPLRDMLGLNVE